MSHYMSNVRDLAFNLFEFSRVQDRLGVAPFDTLDEDTVREVLGEVDRLARGPLAASFEAADRRPPTLDPATGEVTLPAELTASIRSMFDGEWYRLNLPVHLGGYGAPPSVQWACAEMVLGANPAVFLYAMTGSSFATILDSIGTADQRRLAAAAIERLWGATMVLTEPDAGSDVGAGRTAALEQPDGSWHISGVKRFITSGDWDLPENIFHLVLARPAGARAGTKGLSLFLVPKYLFDWEDFSLGARNGVKASNLEHKMGLKASSTCELTFGADAPAVGYLVGDVHDGIAQMFLVIEQARMMVGTKAIATLSTGYLNALAYARDRVQGADLADTRGSAAPRVGIMRHPDVRRSLLTQKSYAEGMRALYVYATQWQDQIRIAQARGERDAAAVRMNDLLLPIVKGYGSERSYAVLSAESLQTLGGSGYLQDYPLEQYIRDAKIDTLYEGTTAIQGQDLFFRKIVKDQGRALAQLSASIQEFISSEAGDGRLKDERVLLAAALADVQAMVSTLVGWTLQARTDPDSIYRVGLNTSRLLMALGDLVTGWLLLQHCEIALGALAGTVSPRDQAFYEGKIASGRFFAAQVLPGLSAARAVLEGTDDAVMSLGDESF